MRYKRNMARFRPPSTPAALRASEAWQRDAPGPEGVVEAYVELSRFGSPVEAELARGRLQCAGIDARLHDVHTVSIAWHLAHAMGGIRLSVPAHEQERARELLDTAPRVVLEEFAGDDEAEPEDLATAAEHRAPASAGAPSRLRTRRIAGWVLAAAVLCLAWRRRG